MANKTRINHEKLLNSLLAGSTKAEAAIVAGSTSKYPTNAVNKILKARPDLVQQLKEKIQITMDAMDEPDIKKVRADQKAAIVERLHKITLLEDGRPTEIKTTITLTGEDLLNRANELLGIQQTRIIDAEVIDTKQIDNPVGE